ncbi:hypothetical protein [Sulfuracidifex tepidarius]|nr:hypothetical protein [Sulfuracidifex tepidarius]
MRKSRTNNIVLMSSFTIDNYENNERPGGPALFSTLGIIRGGGLPSLIVGRGSDFHFSLKLIEDFIYKLILGKNTFYFKIETLSDGKKKVKLLKSGPKINALPNDGIGVLLNPVCREIDGESIYRIEIPIAIDIQGFSRICKENMEVSLSEPEFPVSKSYLVLHGNSDEINSIYDNLHTIFKFGFREILISYGHDGFELLTSDNKSYYYNPTVIGPNEIGNGDFLIGSYFALRLSRVEISDAVKKAGELSDKFSNENISLLFAL